MNTRYIKLCTKCGKKRPHHIYKYSIRRGWKLQCSKCRKISLRYFVESYIKKFKIEQIENNNSLQNSAVSNEKEEINKKGDSK
jgi:hypothetical protein